MEREAAIVIMSLLMSGGSVSADEIIDQVEIGKQHYVEGNYAAAITEFEFALGTLRGKLSALFVATMPDPPVLWTAEEADSNSGTALFGGGLMITREYHEQKGEGKVKAELVIDSPMAQAFSTVLTSPVMVANEPQVERIRLGETNALLNWDPDERSGDISLSIGGRVLAKMEGDGLSDKAVLIDLMKTWDLDAVKHVAGL